MFNALPKTITKPLAKGYFPGIIEAQKIVSEMAEEVKRNYVYGDWYEFQSIGMGYHKCKGYESHKACDDIIETFGVITFKLKDEVDG